MLKLNNEVVLKEEITHNYMPDSGKIIAILKDKNVIVEYDNAYVEKHLQEDLCLASKAKSIQQDLINEKADLEKDFADVKKQIEEKMVAAAEAVSAGLNLISENKIELYGSKAFDEIQDMLSNLDDYGYLDNWKGSSYNC